MKSIGLISACIFRGGHVDVDGVGYDITLPLDSVNSSAQARDSDMWELLAAASVRSISASFIPTAISCALITITGEQLFTIATTTCSHVTSLGCMIVMPHTSPFPSYRSLPDWVIPSRSLVHRASSDPLGIGAVLGHGIAPSASCLEVHPRRLVRSHSATPSPGRGRMLSTSWKFMRPVYGENEYKEEVCHTASYSRIRWPKRRESSDLPSEKANEECQSQRARHEYAFVDAERRACAKVERPQESLLLADQASAETSSA